MKKVIKIYVCRNADGDIDFEAMRNNFEYELRELEWNGKHNWGCINGNTQTNIFNYSSLIIKWNLWWKRTYPKRTQNKMFYKNNRATRQIEKSIYQIIINTFTWKCFWNTVQKKRAKSMLNIINIIMKNFKLLLRSKSSALIIVMGPLLMIFLVGVAVWVNKDKNGNQYLSIKLLNSIILKAFKHKPKEA